MIHLRNLYCLCICLFYMGLTPGWTALVRYKWSVHLTSVSWYPTSLQTNLWLLLILIKKWEKWSLDTLSAINYHREILPGRDFMKRHHGFLIQSPHKSNKYISGSVFCLLSSNSSSCYQKWPKPISDLIRQQIKMKHTKCFSASEQTVSMFMSVFELILNEPDDVIFLQIYKS